MPIPFVGAVLLASILKNYFWLDNLILLLLFFFAYFFRRYGSRAGELALVTTLGFYIGFLLHPPLAFFPIFAACIVVSVGIIYLWEFVILPYDPEVSLHRGVIGFYHNVAQTVASIRQGFETTQGNSRVPKLLQRQLKQVHQNRRIIEALFAALVSPNTWSQGRLNRLQAAMFKTERGLEQLIEAATQLYSQSSTLPDEVLNH